MERRGRERYSALKYRVSNMDWGHFKEVLWLHLWFQAFFLIILMVKHHINDGGKCKSKATVGL